MANAKWSQALDEIEQARGAIREAVDETVGDVSDTVKRRVLLETTRIEGWLKAAMDALRNDPADIEVPAPPSSSDYSAR